SAAPQECLDELDVEWGVVGAGEAAMRSLVRRVVDGGSLRGAPGLVRRGDPDPGGLYQAEPDDLPTERDPLYAPTHGVPVRARIGCAMACSYCTAATLRRRHADDSVVAVLDEIERAVEAARARGVQRVPVFLCADELNLPGAGHAVALLTGIVERGLA